MRWAVLLLLLLPLVSTSVLADFRPLTANVSTLAAGESVLIEGSWSLSNTIITWTPTPKASRAINHVGEYAPSL